MGLGYVGKIVETRPIQGAERIHTAVVVCGKGGKWTGVVPIDMKTGDFCEVYIQDCILPVGERFDFMDKYHRRVAMKRFKGAPSDCLIMPLTIVGVEVGYDLTEAFGLRKYEKEVIYGQGEICGTFTSLVAKTDEPNFQTVSDVVEEVLSGPWTARLKYDGTSCTILKNYDGILEVYSRNMRIREGDNKYWQIARAYQLDKAMLPGEVLQMEICGPGIQKNPMGFKTLDARVFNYFKEFNEPAPYTGEHGIPIADAVAASNGNNAWTNEELWRLAEVKYANGATAEGIVIRADFGRQLYSPTGLRLSFKVINLLYGK